MVNYAAHGQRKSPYYLLCPSGEPQSCFQDTSSLVGAQVASPGIFVCGTIPQEVWGMEALQGVQGQRPARGSVAEAICKFWLEKRSKFENLHTVHALILDQSVSQWGGTKRQFAGLSSPMPGTGKYKLERTLRGQTCKLSSMMTIMVMMAPVIQYWDFPWWLSLLLCCSVEFPIVINSTAYSYCSAVQGCICRGGFGCLIPLREMVDPCIVYKNSNGGQF